jgi:phosphoribosylamine--glycine ligase
MRVLVVGGGGREHALVWRLARDPDVGEVFAAPGNAGIAGEVRCLPVAAEDVGALASAAERERADLTVVGPEAPLVAGLADELRRRGLAGSTDGGGFPPRARRPGRRRCASVTGSPPPVRVR